MTTKARLLANEGLGVMTRSYSDSCGKQTPATAQADFLRRAWSIYPLRQ